MDLSELKPENLIAELTDRGNLWQLRAQALAVELKRLGRPDIGQGIMQMTDKQMILDGMNRGPTVAEMAALSSTTTSDGFFTLSELGQGSHLLSVEASNYLAAQITVTVTTGQALVTPAIILSGGDLNANGQIDIADATLVSANFGQNTPGIDNPADINADGQVTIQDLALIGGNFGKIRPEFEVEDNSMVHHLYLPVIIR